MPEPTMDLFATKGIEYLLVIGFLVSLLLFWLGLNFRRGAVAAPARPGMERPGAWFGLAMDRLYHQGHTWARPDPDGLVTVGVDDLAGQMIGSGPAPALPAAGSVLRQGDPGWVLRTPRRDVAVLSPVSGEVAEVNPRVLADPDLVRTSPYEDGWILRVRGADAKRELSNLLRGDLARTWMRDSEERLRTWLSPEPEAVAADGGYPLPGFLDHLETATGDRILHELLGAPAGGDGDGVPQSR